MFIFCYEYHLINCSKAKEYRLIYNVDRLDRANASEPLPIHAIDPCAADNNRNSAESAQFKEYMARTVKGGDAGLEMGDLTRMDESMNGKGPQSFDKDMTPHHLCAFTFSVLERFLTYSADSPMKVHSNYFKRLTCELCSSLRRMVILCATPV